MEADKLQIEYNFKYTPHFFLLGMIFFFQYFSKSNEVRVELNPDEKKKADKIFWKYLIVFQLAKAADWCLGPFVYEFFESYHGLTVSSIGKMIAISFLSNLFFGPFLIGYINDKFDKKFPCILFGILLGGSCIVRQIKHPFSLIMSQLLFGVSSSVLYSSFENWFVSMVNKEILDDRVKEITLSAAFEKSMIGDSLTAVTVSFITGALKKKYGIQAPYIFSACLCGMSILINIIILNSIEIQNKDKDGIEIESKHEFIDVLKNLKDGLIVLKNKPFIILIGLTESLLFCVLHLFIFIWTPTLRELNSQLDTNEIFTLFMMSLMVGGAGFRAIYFFYNNNSFKVVNIVSTLCFFAFILANLQNNYNVTLGGFLLYEISVGMLYPSYSKIKAEYLPSNLRGTLMNIFKIPLNLAIIFFLLTMNWLFSIKQLLLINLIISFIVFTIHKIWFHKSDFDMFAKKQI